MKTMTESGLTLDQVSRSAYAAYLSASGVDEASPFDDLAEETKAFWFRLAEKASIGLESQCEGKPVFEAAQWLASLADKQLVKNTKDAFVWEALARHFCFLIDAGDEEEPSSMEGFWKDWVKNKVEQLPAVAVA